MRRHSTQALRKADYIYIKCQCRVEVSRAARLTVLNFNETSGRQADHKVDERRTSTSEYVWAAVLPEQI